MRGLLPEEAWKARGALRATSLKGRPPQHHISKRGREACVWPSTPPILTKPLVPTPACRGPDSHPEHAGGGPTVSYCSGIWGWGKAPGGLWEWGSSSACPEYPWIVTALPLPTGALVIGILSDWPWGTASAMGQVGASGHCCGVGGQRGGCVPGEE